MSNVAASFERLSFLSYPLVRITAGLLLMPHGAQKLFGWFGGYGLTATGEFFGTQLGLQPGLLFALLAGLVEFFGGLALVVGLLTRPAALATSIVLCVTTYFHWVVQAECFPGAEKSLLWLAITLYFVAHGGGRFSIDRAIGRQF